MVMKNCGPRGYPGMAEVGNMGLPPKVLRKGITDMVRISDARRAKREPSDPRRAQHGGSTRLARERVGCGETGCCSHDSDGNQLVHDADTHGQHRRGSVGLARRSRRPCQTRRLDVRKLHVAAAGATRVDHINWARRAPDRVLDPIEEWCGSLSD